MIVTFEGIDGSGKTTLIKDVAKILGQKPGIDGQPITTVISKAPSWGSDSLRQVEANQLPPLQAAAEYIRDMRDMQQAWERWVKPGMIVLQDRWSESTVVYQAMVASLDEDKINTDAVVDGALQLAFPSLTVYLQCPSNLAQQRIINRDGAGRWCEDRLKIIGKAYDLLYDVDVEHTMTSMQRTTATEYQYKVTQGIYGQDVIVIPSREDDNQAKRAGVVAALIEQKLWGQNAVHN